MYRRSFCVLLVIRTFGEANGRTPWLQTGPVMSNFGRMQAGRSSPCQEDFYRSSALEARFSEDPIGLTSTTGTLCSALGTHTEKWMYRNRANGDPPSDDNVFSTLCRKGSVEAVLEPLAGILRSPRYPCRKDDAPTLLSVDWLVLADNRTFLGSPTSKRIFFDAGGSKFMDAMHLFAAAYEHRGLPFDAIYVWEATFQDNDTYWEGTPAALRQRWEPHLTFYNGVPVTDEAASRNNPVAEIHRRCKAEDFCVFKLDIDTPPLEWSLARQLLAEPGHLKEFFFEHHVHGWMERIWHMGEGTIADSYNLFARLRQKGVRAHSWI
mmetsp:Transcript_54364/g.101934  ORF Transcript_54364/g.101934 Transcript_54364/m.101934 type:complete len:322 (-) Transcript_54364:43-1008(-)